MHPTQLGETKVSARPQAGTYIFHSAAFSTKPELAPLSSGALGMTGAALILARHRYTGECVSISSEPVLSPERGEEQKKKGKKEKRGKGKTVKKRKSQRRRETRFGHSAGIQLCMKGRERNEHIWRGNGIGG